MQTPIGYAKKRVLAAFGEKDRAGLVVIVKTTQVNRIELLAWAVNEFIGDADPQHPCYTLVTCKEPSKLDRIRRQLRSARQVAASHPVSDQKISIRSGALPQLWDLRELNYCVPATARTFVDQREPGTLKLVAIDQYGGMADDLDNLPGLVERAQPNFALIMVSSEQVASSMWQRFGEPILLGYSGKRP